MKYKNEITISKKQKEAILESKYVINLFEGSTRSGKTFTALLRWFDFIITEAKVDELLFFCAPSMKKIERNIKDIEDIVGPENVKYTRSRSELFIYGRRHFVLSADNERNIEKISGAIVKGIFCDEVNFYSEGLANMLITRASIKGAKSFWTCNPIEDPEHFIKKKFIDAKNKINEKYGKQFQNWNFVMDDNPSLNEDFKKGIKELLLKQYTEDQYNRLVLGKWPDENIPT